MKEDSGWNNAWIDNLFKGPVHWGHCSSSLCSFCASDGSSPALHLQLEKYICSRSFDELNWETIANQNAYSTLCQRRINRFYRQILMNVTHTPRHAHITQNEMTYCLISGVYHFRKSRILIRTFLGGKDPNNPKISWKIILELRLTAFLLCESIAGRFQFQWGSLRNWPKRT